MTAAASAGSAIGSKVELMSEESLSLCDPYPATSTSSRCQPSRRHTYGSSTATPCTRANGMLCDERESSPRSMRSPSTLRVRVKSHCVRIRLPTI